MIKVIVICLFVSSFITISQSANIFAAHVLYSKSHYVLTLPLHKELVRSGHNLTVLTFFRMNKHPIENFHEIVIDLPLYLKQSMEDFMGEMINNSDSDTPVIPKNWTEMNLDMYGSILRDKQVKHLMESGVKFDLMIAEPVANDFIIGFANYFQVPVVMISTLRTSPWITTYTGSPSPPAYVPHVMGHAPKEMNFLQRVRNTLLQAFFEGFMIHWAHNIDVSLLIKLIPISCQLKSDFNFSESSLR